MTNQKPATALPWITNKRNQVCNAAATAHIAKCAELQRGADDAAYIAHSANAYPQLVEALRNLSPAFGECVRSGLFEAKHVDAVVALLRELGEAS